MFFILHGNHTLIDVAVYQVGLSVMGCGGSFEATILRADGSCTAEVPDWVGSHAPAGVYVVVLGSSYH